MSNNGMFLCIIKTSKDGVSNPQIMSLFKIAENESSLTKEDLQIANLRYNDFTKYKDMPPMNKIQQEKYDEILKIASERGYLVISSRYERRDDQMTFVCPYGHIRTTNSRLFRQNTGCTSCNHNSSIRSENNFISNIEKLGATVIGQYMGCNAEIECLCKNGHTYFCKPVNARSGKDYCKQCNNITRNKNRTASEIYQDFIDDVTKLGGKVVGRVTSEDIKATDKIECICSNGHTCYVHVSNLRTGGGLCNVCNGMCPVEASKKFYSKIIESGGTIVGTYSNTMSAVECICPSGHICYPVPVRFNQSGNMCTLCTGSSIILAEQKFINNVTSQGGSVIGNYVNKNTHVECICSLGHICYPCPRIIKKSGFLCYTCDKTNGSYGERLIEETLKLLSINFLKEQCHPLIPKLRFDFYFEYNDIAYYVEYDGKQHFFDIEFFHKGKTFEYFRQKDLMKNYIINLDTNSRLIRFDYKWSKTSNKEEIIDNMILYIKECLSQEGKIFVSGDLYTWIYDLPTEETINRYYNNHFNLK
jgi:hypothetical protein